MNTDYKEGYKLLIHFNSVLLSCLEEDGDGSHLINLDKGTDKIAELLHQLEDPATRALFLHLIVVTTGNWMVHLSEELELQADDFLMMDSMRHVDSLVENT